MSDYTNYVAVPFWLLILLIFLSSGALQYLLIGAVRFVKHVAEQRELKAEPKSNSSIITLDDIRAERAGGER